jgi:hypothetical protein
MRGDRSTSKQIQKRLSPNEIEELKQAYEAGSTLLVLARRLRKPKGNGSKSSRTRWRLKTWKGTVA